MAWQQYFKVVKVVPGRMITPRHGLVDLSRKDINLDTLRELYEEDWPYIEITDAGREALYGKPVEPEPLPTEVTFVPEPEPEVTESEENVTETEEIETVETDPETPVQKKKTSRARKAI